MAINHKNRVQMSVSGTPGTGTITLGSAVSAYQSFSAAYGANATVDVLITDGTAWEVARSCTYTHSGTTLSRGTLEASSTGSAISLTSAAVVSQIPTAQWGNWLESAMQAVTPGGRLTLESGVPISTTDQTAKTTIYYTPYVHDTIPLWDGARWVPTTFAETSLALGTITNARPYDVFAYLSSGVLALELLAWTNDTTRATAVTLQDGRYCKSGDKTRLLLGTFYTTATTTTEDSLAKRYLSNAYNALERRFYFAVTSGSSHTYTTATWREWNNGTNAARAQVVSTLPGNRLDSYANANLVRSGAGVAGYINISLDATDGTNNLITNLEANTGGTNSVVGSAAAAIAAGKHYLTLVEFGVTGTTYFVCDLQGFVQC